jgi:predicted metal-binding membrane protein
VLVVLIVLAALLALAALARAYVIWLAAQMPAPPGAH